MSRPMKRHPTLWLHEDGTTEPENRASIPSPEELEDITDNKIIAVYQTSVRSQMLKRIKKTPKHNMPTWHFSKLGLNSREKCKEMCMQ